MLARVQIKDTKMLRLDVKREAASVLVETMSSYVPNFILRSLAANHNPLVEPKVARFPACILFIDVSGMLLFGLLLWQSVTLLGQTARLYIESLNKTIHDWLNKCEPGVQCIKCTNDIG
jgi:hypothetical protein